MRFASPGLASWIVLAAATGGCAGGTRARGSVQTGLPEHDDFFHRVRTLLATVESVEETLRAPVLVDPPAGMELRIAGEGPTALVRVEGAPDPQTHLLALVSAQRLAEAPPLLDAVQPEVEALLARSPALRGAAILIPGPRGHRLRAAHVEAEQRLKDLPERARAASAATRELLGKLYADVP